MAVEQTQSIQITATGGLQTFYVPLNGGAGAKYIVKYLSISATAGFAVVPAQTYTYASVGSSPTSSGSVTPAYATQIPATIPGNDEVVTLINTANYQLSTLVVTNEVIIDQPFLTISTYPNTGQLNITVSYITIIANPDSPFVNASFAKSAVPITANNASLSLLANATTPGTQVYIVKSINIIAPGAETFKFSLAVNGNVPLITSINTTVDSGYTFSIPIYINGGQGLFANIASASGVLTAAAYISYNVST